ncbi:mitochondrial 54S ribosomal protein [Maudiozyma humilis]|uniref:Mitochondrial 54S ribosomal protein n=1 Tax=Maudiozyma humilis TaxID=51915 RepID=A0AAV5RWX5_MAUHU|nr:mitochondrial 54S ribosomal protein [Kazachstania humilis]
MFKPTRVCLSALTKRTKKVKVQLMRDFPRFQLYKGQVAQVKPSLMRNYLHNFNGAKYILQDADINAQLLDSYNALEQERERAAQAAHAAAVELAATQQRAQAAKPKLSQEAKRQDRRTHDKNVTIKDVYIPGLDI